MNELSGKYIEVVIDKYVDLTFDYFYPETLGEISIGSFVKIPFRNFKTVGCVVKIKSTSQYSKSKIKSAEENIEHVPAIKKELMNLGYWISEYYGCPLGMIIKSMVPPYVFKTVKCRYEKNNSNAFVKSPSISLNEAQKNALKDIEGDALRDKKNVFLLWGVTGSGKTEVYLRAIENELKENKSALVIVPEIALTPQLIKVFEGRFNEPVAVFHSKIKDSKRSEDWIKVASGEIRIVIGARSAVFSPLRNLGVVVVDEEHERTYKQEEAPRYNARDIAILRGKFENATVILCSATPSMESFYNSRIGKYNLLKLPERVSNQTLPDVELVDMEHEYKIQKKHFLFSRKLLTMIEDRLNKKEQIIIFLNKRGFSTCLLCSDCGNMVKCADCSVLLTYHKKDEKCICHRCQKVLKVLKKCPDCKKNTLKFIGFGTEKVEKQIKNVFKNAKVARIDSDTVSKKGTLENLLEEFSSGEIDILIGTQMIAKGLHNENVTLVGVLAADLSLNIPNFRAGENTFQLITQVAGRAGRGSRKGEVIVQAFNPKNPIIQSAISQDFESFFESELNFRKMLNYPPLCRFIIITITDSDENKAAKRANLFHSHLKVLPNLKPVRLYPPIPSPISKIKKKYRFQILISTRSVKKTVKAIYSVLNQKYSTQTKHFIIDTDPYTML